MILLFLLTLLLQPRFSAASKEVQPQRMADQILKLSKQWQSCEKSVDCVAIGYGCGNSTAVNRSHREESIKKAYQIGGDPRAMDCAMSVRVESSGPKEVQCREKKCGMFQYPDCKDKDCKEKYPLCEYASKFLLNPAKPESFSLSKGYVWGPTKEVCAENCRLRIKRTKLDITNPNAGEYQIDCLFAGVSMFKETLKGSAMSPKF